VAGHRGMAGSALVRQLREMGCHRLVLRTHAELDLAEQARVRDFFRSEGPEYVFLAAARVGGLLANDTYRAEFIHDNLAIQTNVIHEACRAGVRRLLFLGSSCIYPRDCPQPMREEHLLTGPLELTNRPYALAKIAGIEMCWSYNRQYGTNYLCAMPTNLYGPGDNFDLESSHVVPALIRKAHEAKVGGDEAMVLWGSGRPRREFLHVEDCADALVFLLQHYWGESHVNVGTGREVTVAELAETVCKVVGFEGRLEHDTSKPDGMPRKLLDVSRLTALGWTAMTPLEQGLADTYAWYLENVAQAA